MPRECIVPPARTLLLLTVIHLQCIGLYIFSRLTLIRKNNHFESQKSDTSSDFFLVFPSKSLLLLKIFIGFKYLNMDSVALTFYDSVELGLVRFDLLMLMKSYKMWPKSAFFAEKSEKTRCFPALQVGHLSECYAAPSYHASALRSARAPVFFPSQPPWKL